MTNLPWAYVAELQNHPAGVAFRARCLRCPWMGGIMIAEAHKIDTDMIDAAEHGAGLVADVAGAAAKDLAAHLRERHGITPTAPRRQRWKLARG